MIAIFGYIGTDLQSRSLGKVNRISVLIWGKLTKFLKYTYNEVAAVIVSAASVIYARPPVPHLIFAL
jgi:energy-converting hydrogenase Eha subunit C